MSAQTSYEIYQEIGYAGLIYALHPHDIDSRLAEGDLEFGIAVSRGSDTDRQVIPGGTSFFGITVRALDREGYNSAGDVRYSDTESAACMRDGYIWAVCPTGCVAGDSVNYVNATGVLDSGTAVAGETQLDGAEWVFSAAAGELSVIRIESQTTTAGS